MSEEIWKNGFRCGKAAIRQSDEYRAMRQRISELEKERDYNNRQWHSMCETANEYVARITELEKRNAELVAEKERIWVEHYGCCDCENKNEHGWGCALNKQKECIANNFKHWKRKETK